MARKQLPPVATVISFIDCINRGRPEQPGQGQVAVLGYTTGSHLEFSDQQERTQLVIWLAETQHGRLRRWRLRKDTLARRRDLGLG